MRQRRYCMMAPPVAAMAGYTAEADQVKPEDKPLPKPVGLNVPAPATIVVSLPADAKLIVDGAVTMATSAERVFTSPTLNPGVVYNYTMQVEFVKNGQTMTETKTVEVRAGAETRVTFAAEAVASR